MLGSVMATDSVLQNAIRRREAALAEARRWDDFVQAYEELRREAPTKNVGVSETKTRRLVADAQGVPQVVPGTGTMSDTENMAADVIRAHGRHVPTRLMMEELGKRGLLVGGKDPLSTLSARLSRAPSLVNVRALGWTLRSLPQTEAPGSRSPDTELHSSSSPQFQLDEMSNIENETQSKGSEST